MAASEEINADMLAFWNGKGGDTWVGRQTAKLTRKYVPGLTAC